MSAQPSWDDLRAERDKLLEKESGARINDYLTTSDGNFVTCPDCGRTCDVRARLTIASLELYGEQDTEEEDEYGLTITYHDPAGDPEWSWTIRWEDRVRPPRTATIEETLAFLRTRIERHGFGMETLKEAERRIAELLTVSEDRAPDPVPVAPEPGPKPETPKLF